MSSFAPVAFVAFVAFLLPSLAIAGPVDDAKKEWAAPDADIGDGFLFTKAGAADRRVTSCAAKADAEASGYTRDTANYRADDVIRFDERCAGLKRLASSKSASESYVRDYKLGKSTLGEIPACLESGENSYMEMMKKATAQGTSWRAVNSRLKVTSTGDGRLGVEEPGIMTYVLSLGPVADFNGDGLEDVTLEIAGAAVGGSMRTSTTLILTRKKGEKMLRIVEGEFPCASTLDATFSACTADKAGEARALFQKAYNAKKFDLAYIELAAFDEKCKEELIDTSRAWVLSDLAITAHHLDNDELCRTLLDEASTLENRIYDDRINRALAANRKICTN